MKTDKTHIRKQIDLPLDTVKALQVLAANEYRPVKKYIELLIINHAKKPTKL